MYDAISVTLVAGSVDMFFFREFSPHRVATFHCIWGQPINLLLFKFFSQ
jgi:hypothetical protein